MLDFFSLKIIYDRIANEQVYLQEPVPPKYTYKISVEFSFITFNFY